MTAALGVLQAIAGELTAVLVGHARSHGAVLEMQTGDSVLEKKHNLGMLVTDALCSSITCQLVDVRYHYMHQVLYMCLADKEDRACRRAMPIASAKHAHGSNVFTLAV